MNQYRFQRSFSKDPTLSSRLFNLLEVVFPELEISNAAECARKLGAPWEDASTPFMRFQDDLAITHVGVVEIPMQLMGEMVTVGGIHGVCTRPEFRRRGYYREVMQEVLDYCDKRYKTLVLTTAQPELYEPFGFRVVQEHVFISKCNTLGGTHGLRLHRCQRHKWRSLNTNNIDDVKLLQRLLETREPVSHILGIVKESHQLFQADCKMNANADIQPIVLLKMARPSTGCVHTI